MTTITLEIVPCPIYKTPQIRITGAAPDGTLVDYVEEIETDYISARCLLNIQQGISRGMINVQEAILKKVKLNNEKVIGDRS